MTDDECGDCLCEICQPTRCPACGDIIDYCQGHGQMGDPYGWRILEEHDAGNHERCHHDGCEYYGL